MKEFNPYAIAYLIYDSFDRGIPIVDDDFDVSDVYLLELVYNEIKETGLNGLTQMYNRFYNEVVSEEKKQ